MKPRRIALAALTSLAMSFLVFVAPAESAPREWSNMAVSRDGKTWTRGLETPLFPPEQVWVPGDQLRRSFLVRNRSAGPGTFYLSIVTRDKSRWLDKQGLRFHVRSGKHWKQITSTGRTRVLQVRIPPAKARKIVVRVSMSPRSGNSTMGRSLPFRLKLRMTSVKRGSSR